MMILFQTGVDLPVGELVRFSSDFEVSINMMSF